jgi:putative transposase
MPWKVVDAMELRKKFVLRVLSGEKLVDVCNEFGITRKTGHKFLKRFKQFGERGLADQSRRPKTLGKQLDLATTSFLLKFKKEKPTWGAPKLREIFIRKCPNLRPPAVSTIHALLDRHGLVKRGRQTSLLTRATGTAQHRNRNCNPNRHPYLNRTDLNIFNLLRLEVNLDV